MIEIQFISIEEKLPPKSGKYVIISETGTFYNLPYSKRHRKFNVEDRDGKEMATECEIKARYWAEMPPFLRK